MFNKADVTKLMNEKFVWLGKSNSERKCRGGRSDRISDISIKKWSTAPKHVPEEERTYRYGFTLRGKSLTVFDDYIDLAIYKNRVLFRVGAPDAGYKLCRAGIKKGSVCPNKYFSVAKTSLTAELEDFIGNYELKHDDFYDLYYIEKEKDE